MDEFLEVNRRNWEDRVPIHVRDATGFYRVDDFLAGRDNLHAIESEEIGEVSGKRLLHLQCHFGLDTLSLARRGALVAGLDFSPNAVAAARDLAQRAGLPAQFIEANVYEARERVAGTFDMVYVTWGALAWLPDVARWAAVVASMLAPMGSLYLAELHPACAACEEVGGRLVPTWPWRTPADRPLVFNEPNTYNGDSTPLGHTKTCEWIHPLSEILSGLMDAGLVVEMFHEHERLPWRPFPSMVEAGDRFWRLPDTAVPLPLAFSLRARKP